MDSNASNNGTPASTSSDDPASGLAVSEAGLNWAVARETGENPLEVSGLQIETSSICNFRCPSCPLAMDGYERPEEHMDVARFEHILDQFPHAKRVEMQGLGEVFLNPCVLDLIRAAVARGVLVQTFSNASKIDRATARQLVEVGLHTINFSMDGSNEETFRKARKGGTLARYKRSVANLVEARRAVGSATPHIGVMTVLSKLNVHQVPQMLAIAEGLGVDRIIFTKINAAANPDLRPLTLGKQEAAYLSSLPPYEGRLEVSWATTPWTKQERIDCYWPKHMAYVTVKGTVTPCCNHWDEGDNPLGNVLEQTGAEVWNSEDAKAFRRRLWNGDLPQRCREC
ncbi:MAG: radical SAM protein [Planctomycetota bacterium]